MPVAVHLAGRDVFREAKAEGRALIDLAFGVHLPTMPEETTSR
ncbi:hypothetical protein Q0M94_20595 (plasmid) [Deinococcus radiomollis]